MGVLLTEKLVKILALSTNLGKFHQAEFFMWNDAAKTVELVTSPLRRPVYWIHGITSLIFYAYINLRIVMELLENGFNAQKFVIMFVIDAYYGFIPFIHFTAMFKSETFVATFQDLFACVRKLEATDFKGMKEVPVRMRICELVAGSVIAAFCGNGITFWTFAMFHPNSVESIYPVLSKISELMGIQSSFVGIGLIDYVFAIFQAYILLVLIPLCCVFAVYVSAVLFLVSSILIHLRKEIRNSKTCRLRIKLYLRLAHIVQGVNESYGYLIWGTEVLSISLALLSCVYAIKVGGAMSTGVLLVGLGLLTFILSMFSFIADLHHHSSLLLTEWKSYNHLHSSFAQKSLRTLQPLRVKLGSWFYIDKLLVLTVCRIVSEALMNILLAVSR